MPEAAARLGARWSRRRAFITGAGSGLGLALATELAKAGWTIGRFDREAQRLAETAPALQAAGGSVYDYLGDVTNEAAFAAALDMRFPAKSRQGTMRSSCLALPTLSHS